MHLALIGPGAIGSTFAFHLARAGHDVTVVARGQRLARLREDGAVVRADGARAPVTVAEALDPATPFDVVLVTVLASQVQAVLPALAASAAKQVMFMFNTFDELAPLREAVGPGRCCFGFPGGVFTLLVDGRIHPQVRRGTVCSEPAWAEVFTRAGIPTSVEADMQGYLRTHVAMVVPMMSMAALGRAATWAEARRFALAWKAGFRLVRALGETLRPAVFGAVDVFPVALLAGLLWMFSRTQLLRDLGKLGPAEPRQLIDAMQAARPDLAGAVRAVRP